MVNAVSVAAGLGPQVWCFPHTVNLGAKNAINQESRLLVRKVVTLLHQCTPVVHALKTEQELLDILGVLCEAAGCHQ